MTVAISGGGLPSEANDTLFGTPGDDTIDLLGGDDTYDGGLGNDTITGGTGADILFGNGDNDTFILYSGDTAPGETIDGGNGVDTIQIDGGGTVSFSGMTIVGIEAITMTDLTGTTLDLSGLTGSYAYRTALASSITSAGGAADVVKLGVWHADYAALNSMFDAGVETVTWTNVRDITYSAERQMNGQIITDLTDTANAVGWTTKEMTQDSDGTIRAQRIVHDDGAVTNSSYDASGVIVSQTVEDLADARGFRGLSRSFTDGSLSELVVTTDNGVVSTINVAPNGDRLFVSRLDLEDNQAWESRVSSYVDGVISRTVTTYDAGDSRTSDTAIFRGGALDSRTVRYDDGRIHVIGTDGDNIIESTGARETLTGNAGADVFLFKTGVGVDIITDYEDGVDMFDFNTRGIDSRADLESLAFLTQFGDHLEIAFISGDNILLYNVDKSQIDDSDFVVNAPMAMTSIEVM